MADNLQVDDICSTGLGPVSFSRGIRTPNAVLSTSADYVILTTDPYSVIEVTTGATGKAITLPATASSGGRTIVISKADSGVGAVTISPTAGTINGAGTFVLSIQYGSVQVYCDASNWYVVSGALATATVNGLVSTVAQNFGGVKTFNDGVKFSTGGSETTLTSYQEISVASVVFSSNGAGATNSPTTTLRFTKIGRVVTLHIPNISSTSSGTGGTTWGATAVVPAALRPVPGNNTFAVMGFLNGGTLLATPAMLRITSGGNLTFYRDGTTTATFTNSTALGLNEDTYYTYVLG